MPGIAIQKVWRAQSSSFDGAFRVWEVLEVMGDVDTRYSGMVECRDGSYILVHCMNFWTEAGARESYNFEDVFQETILV